MYVSLKAGGQPLETFVYDRLWSKDMLLTIGSAEVNIDLEEIKKPKALSESFRPLDYLTNDIIYDIRDRLQDRGNVCPATSDSLREYTSGIFGRWSEGHQVIVDRWGGLRKRITVPFAYSEDDFLDEAAARIWGQDFNSVCHRITDTFSVASRLSEKSIASYAKDKVLRSVFGVYYKDKRRLWEGTYAVHVKYAQEFVKGILLNKRMPDQTRIAGWYDSFLHVFRPSRSMCPTTITRSADLIDSLLSDRVFEDIWDFIHRALNDRCFLDVLRGRIGSNSSYTVVASVHPLDILALGRMGSDNGSCFRDGGEYSIAPLAILQSKNSVVIWGELDSCPEDDSERDIHGDPILLPTLWRCWGAIDYLCAGGDVVITNYYPRETKGNIADSAFSEIIPLVVSDLMGWDNSRSVDIRIDAPDWVYLNCDSCGYVDVFNTQMTVRRVFKVDESYLNGSMRECDCCNELVNPDTLTNTIVGDQVCEYCLGDSYCFVEELDGYLLNEDTVYSDYLAENLDVAHAVEAFLTLDPDGSDTDWFPEGYRGLQTDELDRTVFIEP